MADQIHSGSGVAQVPEITVKVGITTVDRGTYIAMDLKPQSSETTLRPSKTTGSPRGFVSIQMEKQLDFNIELDSLTQVLPKRGDTFPYNGYTWMIKNNPDEEVEFKVNSLAIAPIKAECCYDVDRTS